ncbi:MAG: hypothetical protein ABIQ06_04575 [Caldimonas sp.]
MGLTRRLMPAIAVCVVALAGCSHAPLAPGSHEVVLPLNRAWVDGREVHYVSTDVSDTAMAQSLGVNHVPRLADSLPSAAGGQGGRSLVERVYMFAHGEQINVFASAPRPTGPANADRAYSPLWRVVTVRWQPAGAQRELRSEEAILASEEKGELALTLTGVVVNCPIIRSVDGEPLRGVRNAS